MRVQVSGLQLIPRQHIHGHCLRATAQRWCCRQRGVLRGMAGGVFICGGLMQSQNGWGWTGPGGQLVWPPALSRAGCKLIRALSSWTLQVSKDEGPTASLGTVLGLHHYHGAWESELPLSPPVAFCPSRVFVTPSNSISCNLTWRGTLLLLRPKKKPPNPHSGHFLYTRRNSDLLQISLVILYHYKFVKTRTG